MTTTNELLAEEAAIQDLDVGLRMEGEVLQEAERALVLHRQDPGEHVQGGLDRAILE